MNFRHNGIGLGVALSLASVALTLTAPASAQTPQPPVETNTTPTPDASLDASLTESTDTSAQAIGEATAPSEVEPALPPEVEPVAPVAVEEAVPKTEKEIDAKNAIDTPLPAPSAKPKYGSVSNIAMLKVMELPGTAYPSIQTRGLTFGSLWRTFHGQQWPYMPQTQGEPNLQIGLSGYVWNDLSNTRISVDKSLAGANVNDQNRFVTQTRGVLRVTPTLNAKNGWFAQGNAELVVQGDMRPDPTTGVLGTTDDVWVRFGKWNVFDVTVGRFQAWEIANHYGMAMDWATLERAGAWIVSSSLPKPTDGYGLTYFWDRQNFLLGTYALHVYPTKYLRGELLGHVGAGNSSNASNPYQVDIRPSLIFDIGYLKLKAGYEYGKATPQDAKQKVRDTKNGFGFAAQVVLAPYVEFGGSFARGYQDVLDKDAQADLAASNTVQTVGGFLNVSPGYEKLVFGFGAFLNHWQDMRVDENAGSHNGKVDTNDQLIVYGAAQYNLWSRLYLKFVLSHASNKVEDFKAGSYINNALSGRFRTEFLF